MQQIRFLSAVPQDNSVGFAPSNYNSALLVGRAYKSFELCWLKLK